MAQLFEWVTSNFFVVMIIIGALVSVFGRKGNAKPNGGGEPFGGRGASAQGNPARRPLPNGEGQRRSPFAGAPGQPKDSRTQNTNAGEQRGAPAERKNPAQVSRQMNAEIDKRLREQRSQQRLAHSVENAAKAIERAASGGVAGAVSGQREASRVKPAGKSTAASSGSLPASQLIKASSADELRKGLLWAEILGAPRARKPYSSGRR